MGIPRFYRWLSERYPRINQRIEENVELLPEFDNMYLDANGIIHTCSHPNDEDTTSSRLTMEEMVLNMMGYIDRMVQIIRPRKVLYVAVDGCAPRAKMNQQRSRRFASARDSAISMKNAIEAGELTEEESIKLFDSNVITPGTPFMAELSVHFEFFLRKKIKEDPSWSNLEIIYSGHDVPGEGEHKIMEYIRRTRNEPGYDPNTRHCLCGLDADLMMLGLATHEPHFSLLREEVDFTSFASRNKKNATKEVKKQISKDKWELLRISTLREYMQLEYAPVKARFPGMNFERVVDDWVLMVMFVGNDFLPSIPTMDIFEGALDNLIEIHKEMLPLWQGHLTTDDGKLNWDRIEGLFKRIGETEEAVFKQREEERAEQDRKLRKNQGQAAVVVEDEDDDLLNDEDEKLLDENDDLFTAQYKAQARRRRNTFYMEKFGIQFDKNAQSAEFAEAQVREIVKRYVEGLDWVFNYYYQGVPSWIWFFPFHFAPLASDVKNLASMVPGIKHILGEPFKPFNQLLGCLPASSAHCLPISYQNLMRDPNSMLKEFYPTEWEVDSNGKRNPWEFVNLLPFIDERKLAEAVATLNEKELTEEERARNKFGSPYVYKKDLSNTQRLQSTVKSIPSIEMCVTSKKVFAHSAESLRSKHSPNLLQGYGLMPGDSALSIHPNLSHTASGLFMAKLNTFGSQSRKATFVLRFSTANTPKSAQDVKQFISSLNSDCVWINYPHLHEAKVTQVMDVFGNHFDVATRQWREMTVGEKQAFDREAVQAGTKALNGDRLVGTGGIELDRVYLMLRVKPLNGMKEDPETGLLKRSFAVKEDDTWIPLQLVLFDNPLIDPRFVDAPALPLTVRFPKDLRVICVGEKGYGMLGTVEGTVEDAKQVQVRFPSKAPKQNEFGHLVASTIVDSHVSLAKIAQHMNLHPSVVDKFLGSIKVSGIMPREYGKPVFVDFGLNLRVGKTHVIPGYARSKAVEAVQAAWQSPDAVVRVIGSASKQQYQQDATRNLAGDTFEYTERAVELLVRYRAKFPKLFEKVSRKPNEQEFDKSELFTEKDALDEAEKVMTWLRQIPTYGIPLVPVTSKYMSKEAVVAVQKGADEHLKAEMMAAPAPEVTISLPPHCVVKPPTAQRGWVESPTLHVPPTLGDRVMNLGSATIPFGLKGTVVATHPSTSAVQVAFDLSFMGGTSLSGLCRVGHGALLPTAHILNLSRKAPVPLDGPIRPIVVVTPQKAPSTTPVSTSSVKTATPPAQQRQPRPSPSSSSQNPPQQHSTPTSSSKSVVTTPQLAVPVTTSAPVSASSSDDVDDLARYFKQLMASKSGGTASAPAPAATTKTTASSPAPAEIKPAAQQPASSSPYVAPSAQYHPPTMHAIPTYVPPGAAPPAPIPIHLGGGSSPAFPAAPHMHPPQPPHSMEGVVPGSMMNTSAVASPAKPAHALLDNMFARAHKTENRVFEKKN